MLVLKTSILIDMSVNLNQKKNKIFIANDLTNSESKVSFELSALGYV